MTDSLLDMVKDYKMPKDSFGTTSTSLPQEDFPRSKTEMSGSLLIKPSLTLTHQKKFELQQLMKSVKNICKKYKIDQ